MEDNHIPIDRIAGTSMGAMIGGMYASGHSPAELKQIAASDVFRAVFAMETPYIDASFRRREDRRELPQAIPFGLRGGVSLRNAVLVDAGLNEFLAENLNRYNRSDLSYDSLPIPFRCVATDLNSMQQVVFAGGPMPEAIHASIAIPGVFSPVKYDDHYLVDGAIMDNLDWFLSSCNRSYLLFHKTQDPPSVWLPLLLGVGYGMVAHSQTTECGAMEGGCRQAGNGRSIWGACGRS
jgi:NTE family protein